MDTQIKENESTALAEVITANDLDMADATVLRATFESMFAKADEWVVRAKDIRITSEDQKREMKLARESRLALRDIRVEADKKRKKLKEDSVRRSRAIDGIYNVLAAIIEPIEEHLLVQEKFAERAAEDRKRSLREARTTALRSLNSDPARFADLGAMDDETWATVCRDAELAETARKEEAERQEAIRLEAERIAAAKREEERQAQIKAEAERQERERAIAAENERLRAEATVREEREAEERRRVEAEREAERRKAQADVEARELEARKAREDAARANAALEAEREQAAQKERERLAAEEKQRADAAKARAEAQAAPDREKLLAFAKDVRALQMPQMSTTRGKQIAIGILGRLVKLAALIDESADTIAPTLTGEAAE